MDPVSQPQPNTISFSYHDDNTVCVSLVCGCGAFVNTSVVLDGKSRAFLRTMFRAGGSVSAPVQCSNCGAKPVTMLPLAETKGLSVGSLFKLFKG